jgi:hypothetical protein
MDYPEIFDLLKNIAIPSAAAFISFLVYRWQRTSKQIEIIESFRSAFQSSSDIEQNLAFSLLISLPENSSIRQAFYCLPMDLQNTLLKSAFIGAIRNANISTVRRLLELFPNYRDIIYRDTPLYVENGLPHYGPISYFPMNLHEGQHQKKIKLLLLLISSGEPLVGHIFRPTKITSYDGETGEVTLEERCELESPINKVLFINDYSVVCKVIQAHLKSQGRNAILRLNFLRLLNYSVGFGLFNSLRALVSMIPVNYSDDFDLIANSILCVENSNALNKHDAKKIFTAAKNSVLLTKPIKLSPDVHQALVRAIGKYT